MPKGNALLLATKLDNMSLNLFESLAEDSSRTETEDRPKTPENQGKRAYIPETPRKKAKYKRKATSPPAKEQPENKSTTYFLYLAKNAIESALKAEKDSQKEEYIIDNNIQLLKESLEEILEHREIEIFPESLERLETQRKFDYVQKKFESIGEKIDQISTQIQEIAGNNSTGIPTSTTIPTFTSIPISILIKLISFTDIVKKGSTAIGNIIPHTKIPQKPNQLSYKDRRLIFNGVIEIEKKIDS